ncbi:MAG: hypothetical protein MZV70_41650 [Desulfobacterales bacterium]|nr:hypothetical protein [Desulfobacterales bacterium]
MKTLRLALALALPAALASCATTGGGDTLADLRAVRIEIKRRADRRAASRRRSPATGASSRRRRSPRLTPRGAAPPRRPARCEKEYGTTAGATRARYRAAPRSLDKPRRLRCRRPACRRRRPAAATRKARQGQVGVGPGIREARHRSARRSCRPTARARDHAGRRGRRPGERQRPARRSDLYKTAAGQVSALRAQRPGAVQHGARLRGARPGRGGDDGHRTAIARVPALEVHSTRCSSGAASSTSRAGSSCDAEEAYKTVVRPRTLPRPITSFALYKLGWSFYKQELYRRGPATEFFGAARLPGDHRLRLRHAGGSDDRSASASRHLPRRQPRLLDTPADRTRWWSTSATRQAPPTR